MSAEELKHRSRSEVRRRAIFERQIQLATQDFCAVPLLYSALNHHGDLKEGSLEHTILTQLVEAGESGELSGVRIYLSARAHSELWKQAKRALLID